MKLAHQQDRGAVKRSRSFKVESFFGGDEALVRYAFFGCFATNNSVGLWRSSPRRLSLSLAEKETNRSCACVVSSFLLPPPII